MGKKVYLEIDDKKVLATEITYDDLVGLYKEYIKTYGEVPTMNYCDSKHNMPQQRIIKRVLEENNITFNEFMLQFGKVKHIRTESKDYELFLKKYKEISNKNGYALKQKDLVNNEYGLPSSGWFVKYCPEESVKSFDDFVLWCDFDSNKLKKDDNDVAVKLIQLEKDLQRPITRNDITLENVGFSPIVINRIWGSLNECKKELNLLPTPPTQPRPFEFYEEELLNILEKIYKDLNRKFITWKDIENQKYNPNQIEHKTLTKAFKREGINFFAYLKQHGFQMNKNKFHNSYTFDDGEKTVSSYEYDFSSFLRNKLNLKYGIDYQRDILYKDFINDVKSKINCDYEIKINDNNFYVEVAGIIYNDSNNNWRNINYKTKIENDYKQKMIEKEDLFIKNKLNYLFLFPSDFNDNKFKGKIKRFINV